ncbi:hypothetical protein ACFO0A_01155 [Novosphingobium tardum]|uniref:Uncharacterized protein n=1 Tax=Novosphingobium tardum TaxID=1538021 RepID=A0ABV8RJR0_9SPHN
MAFAVALSVPLSAFVSAPAALAQNAESEADRKVQTLITAQKRKVDLRDPRCLFRGAPGYSTGPDIVVCARNDPEANRLPLRDLAKPADDRLRAPDVSGNGIIKGKPTVAGFCLIPPCPEDKVYIVDVATLPPAPAGSDAERIAKGEQSER